jgi:peptide/nickel transport system substrate-binding protein
MGNKKRKFGLLAGVLLLVGVAAAASLASTKATTTSLVFASSADPALLDPSLVSDGESLRVTDQIFESLVGYKPGTTVLAPELATSWKPSANGLTWTFKLRQGVRFHDGTPFNGAAVCFNYNRWFNFPVPLQSDALSYYWQTVFGGFAKPGPDAPGPAKSLYKSCRVVNASTIQLVLRRRSASFLNAIALPNFAIASPTALKRYKADAGTVDSTGVFRPAGTFATRNPVGTGAFRFKSWDVGNRLELEANSTYWGSKAKITRLIFRPIGSNAARLQALQSGEIQGFDLVEPADFGTVRGNSNLKLLSRPPFSVGYVGMNQSKKPLDNPLVRQAIAHGLDKAGVVSFYAGQGRVANQFLPPALPGFSKSGVPEYAYDPEKSKALLRQAGLTLPLEIEFAYPTSVARPYMPDPKRNAEALGASLEKAGFKVTFKSAPWRPDYRATLQTGGYQLFLFGWIADFPDPANFLNVHFGSVLQQFSFNNPSLFTQLQRADAESNADKRIGLYQRASNQVMRLLPVVPYVWASNGSLAFQKNVQGYKPGPIGPVNEPFSIISIQ